MDPLAHIRLRPGVYIPDVGLQGLHHLLEEVLNNSVDEVMSGNGKDIKVELTKGKVTVTDAGRGIPHEKVVDVFTKTLTGGKFDSDSYNTSSGLNGIGLKAVNALSSELSVISTRDGKSKQVDLGKGKVVKEYSPIKSGLLNGTQVSFTPDPDIFEVLDFDKELLKSRMFYLSSILPGLKIKLILDGEINEYCESDKLKSIQEKYITGKESLFDFTYNSEAVNILLNFIRSTDNSIISFTNTIHNYENGSHVDAVFDALSASLRKITGKIFSRSQLSAGIVLTESIFFNSPVFRGQHKGKVADSRIYKLVYSSIYDSLYDSLNKNKDFTGYLVELATEQERILQELDIKRAINTVKAAARENKLPIKLAVAHNCTSEDRELFLVEGDSAGGTVKMARSKNFQEVLPLRGKVINAFKSQYSDLLSNKEVIDIFLAIGGMENTNTTLRCKNVFIMADSDPDGSHINSLLLSMFAVVYPSFVKNHNLYVVEPPLFTLISDDIRMYGHTHKDLTKKFKEKYKNKSFDIYRNKGLGELNASELEEFINPKTRSIKKMELSNISVSELMKLMGEFVDVRKTILEEMTNDESS